MKSDGNHCIFSEVSKLFNEEQRHDQSTCWYCEEVSLKSIVITCMGKVDDEKEYGCSGKIEL